MFDLSQLLNVGQLLKDIRTALTGKEPLDPQKQLELQSQLREAEATILTASSGIITQEAKSEHWVTSTWRPITMLVFTFIIANNYIFVPYVYAAFNVDIPMLELTDSMWDLLKWGMGGYVIGRSFEKSVKSYSTAMKEAKVETEVAKHRSAMDVLNEANKDGVI